MFQKMHSHLLAVSAAIALSACASQQAAAPVSAATQQVSNGYSQAQDAYNQVQGAYNQAQGAYNSVATSVSDTGAYAEAGANTASNPYNAPTYTQAANTQPTYTPPAYTAPAAQATYTGGQQFGRVGNQYIPNTTPVDKSASVHIVQAGDTVYNISKRYGISQDTLRSLNGLTDNTISLGQTLRVKSGSGKKVGNTTPITQPTTTAPVQTTQPAVVNKPVATTTNSTPDVSANKPAPSVAVSTTPATTTPIVVNSDNSKTRLPTKTATNLPTDAYLPTQNVANIVWQAPTAGKIVRAFGGDNKGVDIAGTRGQAVNAAADGQVVYSDSGLRGYGNLVIIQHTPAYLTAYGHNDSLLVKEGDSVKRGQQIAKMGSTDSSSGVKLHFEVRENGTPVDPTRFVKF